MADNKYRFVPDIEQRHRVRGDKRFKELRKNMQSFTPEEDEIILKERKASGSPYKAAMQLEGRDVRSVIARWEYLDTETNWRQKNPDSYTGRSKKPTEDDHFYKNLGSFVSRWFQKNPDSYTGSSKEFTEDDRFYEILEYVDDTYRGDMKKVKFLANDISTMVKDGKLVLPTRTKTTRDVVYESDYKETSDAQIDAENALEEKINDEEGHDYKAIVKIRNLLKNYNNELSTLNEDDKKFLKKYMQKKMDIIELFMLDDDDDMDVKSKLVFNRFHPSETLKKEYGKNDMDVKSKPVFNSFKPSQTAKKGYGKDLPMSQGELDERAKQQDILKQERLDWEEKMKKGGKRKNHRRSKKKSSHKRKTKKMIKGGGGTFKIEDIEYFTTNMRAINKPKSELLKDIINKVNGGLTISGRKTLTECSGNDAAVSEALVKLLKKYNSMQPKGVLQVKIEEDGDEDYNCQFNKKSFYEMIGYLIVKQFPRDDEMQKLLPYFKKKEREHGRKLESFDGIVDNSRSDSSANFISINGKEYNIDVELSEPFKKSIESDLINILSNKSNKEDLIRFIFYKPFLDNNTPQEIKLSNDEKWRNMTRPYMGHGHNTFPVRDMNILANKIRRHIHGLPETKNTLKELLNKDPMNQHSRTQYTPHGTVRARGGKTQRKKRGQRKSMRKISK